MKMSRSRFAILTVGAFAAAITSNYLFTPFWEVMLGCVVLGGIWGAVVALVLGPED